MRVVVTRPHARRIDFEIRPEEGDGQPPLSSVYLAGEGLWRLGEGMLSLIAFLLVRDLIGNTLVVEGLNIPAHMATAMHRDFAPFDLHCAPITNIDRAILPKQGPRVQSFDTEDTPEGMDTPEVRGAVIRTRRSGYGFLVSVPGEAEGPAQEYAYETSVPLFCAMACRSPLSILHAVMAAVVFDLHGGVALTDASRTIAEPDILALLSQGGLAFREQAA